MAAHSDTPAQDLCRRLDRRLAVLRPAESDADRCRRIAARGPVAFSREVLKLDPWSLQREILESALTHKRIAVTSGHKISKSTTAAILALWFYCLYPGGRVVITATTDNQVNGIIWREIRRLVRRAAKAGIEIPGSKGIHEIASSGLVDPVDFGEIKGYTAKDSEAIAGVSGPAILYLVDEASGVKDHIFEAIQGNRAGGNAWVVLTSNPTRAEGENYEAHHSKSEGVIGPGGYRTFQISSEQSPNVTGEWRSMSDWDFESGRWVQRTTMVPGLATPEWVEEMVRDYGRDSPIFAVRVSGSFVVAELAKIFNIAMLEEAITEPYPAAEGRLVIGDDPAGAGEGGDESAFAVRRGKRLLSLYAKAGISAEEHAAILCDLIDTHRLDPLEVAWVNIESEGEAGWKVYTFLRDWLSQPGNQGRFRLRRIRTSDAAVRQPMVYDRLRDELFANLREWLRKGGKLLPDAKLQKDLHALEFMPPTTANPKLKVTPKKELKKILGRSPDRGDAVALCCWEPMGGEALTEARQSAPTPDPYTQPQGPGDHSRTFDPYGGMR